MKHKLQELDTSYRASIRKNDDKEEYKKRMKMGNKSYKEFVAQAERDKKSKPLRKGEVLRPGPDGSWISNKD